jgi:hypothetical protein
MTVRFARRVLLLAMGLHLVWGHTLFAERAPLSESQLFDEAELIVVGEIVDHRITTERSHIERGFGNYDWAIYVTIKIDEIQKGQFDDSETIVARCFRIKTRRSQVEYLTPSGNRPIPDIGTRVKAYLCSRDGSWRVIFPNGFQPILGGDTLTDAEVVAQLNMGGFTFLLPIEIWIISLVIGVAIFFLVLFVARVFRSTRAKE